MKHALIKDVRRGIGAATDDEAIAWLDKNVPWWRDESLPVAKGNTEKLDDEQEE